MIILYILVGLAGLNMALDMNRDGRRRKGGRRGRRRRR